MTSNLSAEKSKSVFYEENHISSWISKAFSDPSLCNITIRTSNCESIPCIDIVLKSGSSIFKDMLETVETNVITLSDDDPLALKELLVFMHMGECWINSEILAGLMEVGNKYDVKELIELCERFVLEGHLILDIRNCCRIYEASLQCGILDLIRLCRQFIITNLSFLCENNNFLNFKYETMVELANHQPDPFYFSWSLANWAAQDIANRKNKFEDLFAHINLELLKVEDIACLASHSAIETNLVVRELVIDAFKNIGKKIRKNRHLNEINLDT